MSERRTLFGIVAVAAIVRLAWLFAVPTIQVSDAGMYEQLGARLAQTGHFADAGGRPEIFWPVGYPLLLAGLFRVFGESRWVFQIPNLVAGTLLCALVYRLARRSFPARVAVAAGLVTALFPSLVSSTSLCMPQGLLATALVAMALAWTRILRRGVACFGLGLATGFAALTKGTYLLVPFVFLGLDAVRGRLRGGRLVGLSAAVAAGALLVVLPWTLRNLHHFGRPVPLSANSGVVMWIGYNPHATGGYYFPKDPDLNPLLLETDQLRRDALGRELAARFVRENPQALPGLAVRKLWRHFRDDVLMFGLATRALPEPLPRGWFLLGRWSSQVLWGLLLLGAAGWGARRIAGRRHVGASASTEAELALAGTLLWNVSLAVAFHGATKYHYVLVPFLVPVAVAFWSGLTPAGGRGTFKSLSR